MTYLFYLRLIGLTAGTLSYLFLLALILGHRRPRFFERLLFFMILGLFFLYAGHLLFAATLMYPAIGVRSEAAPLRGSIRSTAPAKRPRVWESTCPAACWHRKPCSRFPTDRRWPRRREPPRSRSLEAPCATKKLSRQRTASISRWCSRGCAISAIDSDGCVMRVAVLCG